MVDEYLESALDFISDRKYSNVVAPGYTHGAIGSRKIVANLQTYLISTAEIRNFDAIVVHKGLMHRIDKDTFLHIYFNWSLVFANEVYCIYVRISPDGFDAALQEHSGPVAEFVARLHKKHPKIDAPKSAVIVSAYGVHNVGDDLVSIASEEMLRHIGIETITKSGPAVSLDAIENHDLIALGGGGLLYDSDPENLENYLYPLMIASKLGKKTAILGVGTQGLRSASGRESTARILRNVDFISVRSMQDKRILLDLDETIDLDVVAGQDMAFYSAEILRSNAIQVEADKKVALFSLSSQIKERLRKQNANIDDVCDVILRHLKNTGYRVYLALHSSDDHDFFLKLARRNDIEILDLPRIGIFGTASAYARADLIITSRFHALIYGAIFGKPVISVYGSKSKNGRLLKSYLKSLRSQSEEIDDFNLNRLISKVDRAIPVEPSEVAACEQSAVVMRDQLRDAIMI